MSSKFERLLQNHGAMLCAMTICALFMCTASVYSKQAHREDKLPPVADAFALKNPNAFDPARRRTVRAMKIPRQTASRMASGIDAAEAEDPETAVADTPRVAEVTR